MVQTSRNINVHVVNTNIGYVETFQCAQANLKKLLQNMTTATLR